MFRLDQKISLVTGAASGIGAAIAGVFATAGAKVFAADRDAAGAESQAAAIRARGGHAEGLKLDVTSESDCADAARRVAAQHGALDILVNNVGIGAVGTLLQATGADLDWLFSVNVRGIFNVTNAFLPEMTRRKSGNVINMASIGGVVGIRDRLAYCTTKFAVVGFTKSMALDHATDGIRSNCILPRSGRNTFRPRAAAGISGS